MRDDLSEPELALTREGWEQVPEPARRTPEQPTQVAVEVESRWQDEAACQGMPTGWWFPEPGGREDAARAVKICRSCPVRQECLDYALVNGEREGIWGGLSARARRGQRRTAFNRDLRRQRVCGQCGGPIPFERHTLAKYCSKACLQRSYMDRRGSIVKAEYKRRRREAS